MKPNQIEKFREWINTLSTHQLKNIVEICVETLYDNEEVRISEKGVPYWTSCGENIDGSEEI